MFVDEFEDEDGRESAGPSHESNGGDQAAEGSPQPINGAEPFNFEPSGAKSMALSSPLGGKRKQVFHQKVQPPTPVQRSVCKSCKHRFNDDGDANHCKHCGEGFCRLCIGDFMSVTIPKFGLFGPVKVCEQCYDVLAMEKDAQQSLQGASSMSMALDSLPPPSTAWMERQASAMPQTPSGGSMSSLSGKNPTSDEEEEEEEPYEFDISKLSDRAIAMLKKAAQAARRAIEPRHLNMFLVKTLERDVWVAAPSAADRDMMVEGIHRMVVTIRERDLAAASALTQTRDSRRMLEQWEINSSEISVIKKVGGGAFGEVFKGQLWGKDVAVKTLLKPGRR